MELHHKLRRDPNWHPSGCNICGQVWQDLLALSWQLVRHFNCTASLTLFWNMHACSEPSRRSPLLWLKQKQNELLCAS